MLTSAKEILALDDLPRQAVYVPEWKDSVYVRALNGAERDHLEKLIGQNKTTRAGIAALCCVDEQGRRLFSDADVEALGQKNGQALERIVTAALAFNLITDEALSEAGKD